MNTSTISLLSTLPEKNVKKTTENLNPKSLSKLDDLIAKLLKREIFLIN